MKRTAVLVDRTYLEHENPPGHPERADRIGVLLQALDGAPNTPRVEPHPATLDQIHAVHTKEHVARIAATEGRERTIFDADTQTSPRTYETALLAAGGFLAVLDAILDDRADNGIALVRPPGHHAESNRAMGFCFFNNVAVGARYLQDQHGMERVLIVDWDVHHGNGTQEIFYGDPSVFYVSLHEHPNYPGTGAAEETGGGRGLGTTLNVPLPAGSGDAEYVEAFEQIIEPACRRFAPDFVLISAGFDAHVRDPLASMEMTEAGFVTLSRKLMGIAEACCGGRRAAVLEGGYDLTALRDSVLAVVRELRGDRLPEGVES
jgi:acetoin utilization deacetylase AcuC-like enzyme